MATNTYEVDVNGKTYEVDAPDPQTAWMWANQHASKPDAPYDVGRVTGLGMKALQGATFGWGDEIAGKLGADVGRYRATLDKIGEDAPFSAGASELSGALATPMGAFKALKMNPLATTAVAGGVTGAIQGAGDAKDIEKAPSDAIKQGVAGAMLGPMFMGATKAVSPITSVLGGGANKIITELPGTQGFSDSLARRRVADALMRDGASIDDVAARQAKLGAEARIADSAGENTRGLLDLNANLPGKTKNELEKLIESRIASRPERMDNVVYTVNGGYGKGSDLSAALEAQKRAESAPLYDKVRQFSIDPTPELVSSLNAARELGAFKLGKKHAIADEVPFSLDKMSPAKEVIVGYDSIFNKPITKTVGGAPMSMADLDYAKRGLDSLIESQIDPVTGKVSSLGKKYLELKDRIVTHLDNATIDPQTGVSAYKAAREAFAGPSALQTAIKKGRAFWNENAEGINSLTQGMSGSELEAFRVGASDALREMAGSQTGQNRLLNVWKDRNTREKLKVLIGDDVKFKDVQDFLDNERTLKKLEGLGPSRNSRTFSREAGAEQQTLDNANDLVAAGVNAKTGGLASVIASMVKPSLRTGTPEKVRNSIGDILMSKYSTDEINALRSTMEAIKARQKAAASATGGAAGLLSSKASGMFGGLLDF